MLPLLIPLALLVPGLPLVTLDLLSRLTARPFTGMSSKLI